MRRIWDIDIHQSPFASVIDDLSHQPIPRSRDAAIQPFGSIAGKWNLGKRR